MKTVAEVMKKAKYGDTLTNGKSYWRIFGDKKSNPDKVAIPLSTRSFEIWGTGDMEKLVVIPNLKIIKEKT